MNPIKNQEASAEAGRIVRALRNRRREAAGFALRPGRNFGAVWHLDEVEDAEPGQPAAGSCRILIVEDNPDTADTLRDLLELAGHEVQVAYSGPAGVEAARSFQPEVVLCDLGLPGLDGYSVAAALQRDPVTRPARMIAISGYGEEEVRRRSQEAGFDLHLTKPVDPMQLAQVLT